MKVPAFPHPSIYNLWHSMQYAVLPPPLKFTPTHAPAYWVETAYRKGTIERLLEPPPFPLQKAVINSMYEIDSLMVAPGVLVMRTPRLEEFKPWFFRIDFEEIFGRHGHRPSPNFPLEYIPDSLIIATSVQAWEADWTPSECTKERWATQSKYPWAGMYGKKDADHPVADPPQSTTSGPSATCATPSSTSTRPTIESAS
jgi:hypothetical protein